jgi:hypothetical protein
MKLGGHYPTGAGKFQTNLADVVAEMHGGQSGSL